MMSDALAVKLFWEQTQEVDIEKRIRKYSNEHSAWRIDLFGADFDENKTIIKQAPDLLKRFDRDDVYPTIGFDLIEKLLVKDSKK